MVKVEQAFLKKIKKSESDIPKMEDVAKTLKQQNLLRKEIMQVFDENYWEDFPTSLTWEKLCEKMADLELPAFLERCQKAVGKLHLQLLMK
jgi:hypothetical protein